jgi:hypothetical protein
MRAFLSTPAPWAALTGLCLLILAAIFRVDAYLTALCRMGPRALCDALAPASPSAAGVPSASATPTAEARLFPAPHAPCWEPATRPEVAGEVPGWWDDEPEERLLWMSGEFRAVDAQIAATGGEK